MTVKRKKNRSDAVSRTEPTFAEQRLNFLCSAEVEEEIRQSNIDEVQLQRLRNGERPGALWHLFRSDDAKKIREYINRVRVHWKLAQRLTSSVR